ncbi:hypothetical protein GTA08_BOTSDO01707 [Botryosphaeria dothidea]|uniref:Heterokaryon incompatibility domain-containing protein n=1 Tax=Botryosphaeria dothidea TaxID=55169 RepID=A0A8H4J8P4_9PEZI|nr:hypothetical protein GTA08_BOTSDO01707 [Botryosphaeria dothidea]
MDVSEELRDLALIFEKDYHFNVQLEQLEESEKAQLQLEKILATFKYENEGSKNLCILYYAGHGFSEAKTGDLRLTSNSSQESRTADQRSRNSVAWRGAEQRFKGMQADVLVIFDCCEAGTLQGDFRTQHSFEFLGACSRDQLTPGPGKQSFTRALIWALCQLKDSPGFDSAELKEKIISAPHADDEPRTPVLFPRDYPNFDHVWISPKAPKTDEMASDNSASPRYREDQPTEFLDLRFRFSKRQTEQQVQRLADAFSQFAGDQGSNLGIRRVELMDYASKFRDVALSITSRKRLEIDYPATPVSNENDEREEYADEEDFDDAPEQLQSYNPKPTPPASGYDRHAPLSAQLPPRGNFPVDPPSIGRRPRRLLWMPKSSGQMLSLEWTPGNIYTGIGANGAEVSAREPRRLRKVRGIGVQGVTWNVPRIDPARFTAEMFEKVLWETSKVNPETCLVWVDMACIDQEDRVVQGLEIGRQAQIFRSAQTVAVWLHEHESSALRKVVETLKEQRDTCVTEPHELHAVLDTLFKDTWFSTLLRFDTRVQS